MNMTKASYFYLLDALLILLIIITINNRSHPILCQEKKFNIPVRDGNGAELSQMCIALRTPLLF